MEANSTVIRHWEDVVFENRNKQYGAYTLRRAYSGRVLSGLGVTILFVTAILSIHNPKPDNGKSAIMPPVSDPGIKFTDPESLEIKVRPKERVKPKASSAQRTVVVTRDEVVTADEIEVLQDFISEGDPGLSDIGAKDGIGDISLVIPEPEPVEKRYYDIVEVMPHYEGGNEAMMKFLQKRIRYPRVPRQMQIEGTVYVRFLVNGDGSVSDVEIIKGVHPDCDKEAARVIAMLPAWKGGIHNGRPVSVRMVLPIKFELQ